MSEIINLNRARKARAKAADKVRAAANRTTFGRSAADRKTAEAESRRLARLLDGAKRDE
jgi:hypothetical protein